ncbi:hypothetical protein ATK86_5389 [Nocardia fluminea]|uniref:Uncharacterized protein n=1 Tax=Nocardia fluminea TaxID=134984 RepID=A0A2N3VH58_9NOCA|nr:hypothetical protein ATK86_5389 [Nocardia fluminea]
MEICCSTAVDDYTVNLAVEPERTGSILEFTVSRAGQRVATLDGPVQLFVRHGETPIDTEPVLTRIRPNTPPPLRFRLGTRFPAGSRVHLTVTIDGLTRTADLMVPIRHRSRSVGWRRHSCLVAPGA